MALIVVFRAHKISGWRRGQRILGHPDFVFYRERLCVFVDGCFWHGCPLHATRPKQNRVFWDAKLKRNRERDHKVTRALQKEGWIVLRIWEHELVRRNEKRLLTRIINGLGRSGAASPGALITEKALVVQRVAAGLRTANRQRQNS